MTLCRFSRAPNRFCRRQRDAAGFTLLEVILAIGILGLSLVTINNLVRISYDSARRAADELEARLLAESVMGELLCGGRELSATSRTPMVTTDGSTPRYEYEIQIEPTSYGSLMLLRVMVTDYEDVDATEKKPLCKLERWKIDPNYLSEVAAANASS